MEQDEFGSYFPGPVRGVEIPKDHGAGVRLLRVPNTGDRVAQTAVAMLLEEKLEPIFHPDSYGYRPGRSAHDALAVTRTRCWKQGTPQGGLWTAEHKLPNEHRRVMCGAGRYGLVGAGIAVERCA